MSEFKYNPFARPNAYDVLGITKKALHATSKDISKGYNKEKKAARRIKDTKERAKRLEELDAAKERLQRPEDRVMIDFFQLGDDIFAELCVNFGARLASQNLPTDKIIGPLLPKNRYDNLIPSPLEQLLTEFAPVEGLLWSNRASDDESTLQLCDVEI